MAEVLVTVRDSSLLAKDVLALKTVLLGWINSVLAGPAAMPGAPHAAAVAGAPAGEPMVTELGGRRNSLRDGTALASLWTRLTGVRPEVRDAPASEVEERANWRALLAAFEAARVSPLHESHVWDAAALHAGDVVATITLLAGIAAHFKFPIPRDVYFWEDDPIGGVESPVPRLLSFKNVAPSRLAPAMFAKVFVDGEPTNQTAVFRRGEFVVGRQDVEDGDVLIADKSVSGEHCRIWFDGDNFCICDLGSTHGTLVTQPWAPVLHDLGSRDAPNGKSLVLWRGSEIRVGDSTLVVVHIESTAFYSDYPLAAGRFGLNLDIVRGLPYDGMTTIGVHYPGATYGSGTADEVRTEPVCELGTGHATIAGLDELHASLTFSNFLGRYLFANYACEPARVRHLRAPELGSVAVPRGCIEIVETGDELDLGDVLTFRVTVIPPAAPARV